MRRVLPLLLGILVLAAPVAVAMPNFVNGGFEDNNFNGWTGTGQNYIMNGGFDPRTMNLLPTVYTGQHSAKVGDEFSYGWYGNYNGAPPAVNDQYSSISQRETVGAADVKDLYFAWAAVALQPAAGHAYLETPYFQIDINRYHNAIKSVLYTEQQYTGSPDQPNLGWLQGALDNDNLGGNYHDGSTWFYHPWDVFHIDLSAAGILPGDDLEVVMTTRDCTISGHAGYAYLDGFGIDRPVPNIPEPSTVGMLGLGLAALVGARLKFRG
jgi:hypothetical protein